MRRATAQWPPRANGKPFHGGGASYPKTPWQSLLRDQDEMDSRGETHRLQERPYMPIRKTGHETGRVFISKLPTIGDEDHQAHSTVGAGLQALALAPRSGRAEDR